MYTSQERIKELRERFGVFNGQFWAEYRFKNLNWYLGHDRINREQPGEWFNFGDIRDRDIPRLVKLMKEGEILLLGWKDLGPDTRHDLLLRDGGGLWIAITNAGAVYDVRRDGRIHEPV